MTRMSFTACALIGFLALSSLACGATVTRGSDDPSIDKVALSTKLDRVDLGEALDKWYAEFDNSKFVLNVDQPDRKMAILHIDNDTSEHIESALQNLIESFETKMVNDGIFDVVSNDDIAANAIMKERLRGLGDNVDPETVAALGKEFGVHYFVHGRVGETTEKLRDVKRVQYYLFLKVTEVATTKRVFQSQVPITKQIEG